MKNILLIESDGALAQPLAAALSGRGLGVKVVADGQEGIDVARADRPDAIVLSAELPRMSGYAVCNRLKKDDELRGIPLVVTSAGSPETFEQHRKLRTRAEDYLAKPFGVDALLAKLAPLLGGTGVPASPAADVVPAAIDEVVTIDDEVDVASTLAALEAAAQAPDAGAEPLEVAPVEVARPFEPVPLDARLAVVERERDEARARVAELEAQLVKHEARVMKAYERLRGEEALKERTRRALAIALQLLDGGVPAPGSSTDDR